MPENHTFRIWTPQAILVNALNMAVNVWLGLWLAPKTPATSRLDAWGHAFAWFFAAVFIASPLFLVVKVVQNRRQRIEIDDDQIRLYTRHDEPEIDRPIRYVEGLTYKTFIGIPTEFTVEFNSAKIPFPWTITNRRTLVQLLEERTSQKFVSMIEAKPQSVKL